MIVRETGIEGLKEIIPVVHHDDRGWFMESYRRNALAQAGIHVEFHQDNMSWSRQHVIRGLHFQRAPHDQAKLVSVLHGMVLDVAVDLRPNSVTFKKVFTCRLTATEHNMLFIPAGFAHGFHALEDSLFSYKCSAEYQPGADGGLRWDDPELAIRWELPSDVTPHISLKDNGLPTLSELEKGGFFS